MSGLTGTTDARLQQGLTARVHILETLANTLAEYVSELSHHTNQRISTLEAQVNGGDRPEPYFPSFNEWYQKREAADVKTEVRGLNPVERREALGMAQAQYRG